MAATSDRHSSVESFVPSSTPTAKPSLNSKEVIDASQELSSAALDTLGGEESAEFVTSAPREIKEGMGEDAPQSRGQVAVGSQTSDVQSAQTVATTRDVPKDEKVLKSEVEAEINKEIAQLKKQIKKVQSSSRDYNPYKYHQLVTQLRHCYGVLSRLAYETVENLRGLWMKYVHEKR